MTALFGKRFVTNGFLREETSLALQLNLDWFQPFTRRNNISVGAIYLSILNLPREDRYKLENVILLGIIPNLTHEPNTLEYLLRPLVEELKIFYKDGIHLPKTDRLIKCVLICVTCDLPATRKVCGFLGHSAKLGCSRCLPGFWSWHYEKCRQRIQQKVLAPTNPTSASARCCRSTCSGAAQEASQGEGTWSQVQPPARS